MKFGIKLISILLSIIMISITSTCFAALVVDDKGQERVVSPSVTTSSVTTSSATTSSVPKEAASTIQERATPILNAYIWFGYAISLGMVVFIGIKYMLGAADARANMKTAIVGWLIGALIVFMATTIASLAISFSSPKDGEEKTVGNANSMASEIVSKGMELTN